jgi:hypothetical protein
MKPLKKELREKNASPNPAAERKPRFQIMKLEERIAPCFHKDGKFTGKGTCGV